MHQENSVFVSSGRSKHECYDKWIREYQSAKRHRCFYRRIAQSLVYRLKISREVRLAVVVGSGQEKGNIEAIVYWISLQDKDHTLISLDFESAVKKMEIPLGCILDDFFPSA